MTGLSDDGIGSGGCRKQSDEFGVRQIQSYLYTERIVARRTMWDP